MFYCVRVWVCRGEVIVCVFVFLVDVIVLVVFGVFYLDIGQFFLYVFVFYDQFKVDLEREFLRVLKCLCNMYVYDFNYLSQI